MVIYCGWRIAIAAALVMLRVEYCIVGISHNSAI